MAVTIDGTTGIDKVQDGSIVYADLDSNIPLGTKNLIINGDMRIAQRGTSVAGISSSNGYQTVDRFLMRLNGAGTFTMSQDTDAPSGFSNSLKWACTTADASLAAGDFANIQHRIESQNLQHLAFGTSSAKQFTVSFWVKSSETGGAVLRATNIDGGVAQGQLYTINAANTWEYKTLTFTADTNNGFDNDNGIGLNLYWYTSVGTDRTSGTLRTSTWESSTTTADEAVGHTINIAATTSSYINITGIQLEVGENATPFENRSYGTELALCQRYFWSVTGIGNGAWAIGQVVSSTRGRLFVTHPVVMRVPPTISYTGSPYITASTGSGNSITSISANYGGATSTMLDANVASGLTAGNACVSALGATTDMILVSAEL